MIGIYLDNQCQCACTLGLLVGGVDISCLGRGGGFGREIRSHLIKSL